MKKPTRLVRGLFCGLALAAVFVLLTMAAISAAQAQTPVGPVGPHHPQCPCPAQPPFGCCGQLTCDILRLNANYRNGQCVAGDFACCHNNSPAIHTVEGLQVVEVRRGRNRPFDGLTDDVRVLWKVDGKRALRGHYKVQGGRGVMTMDNGDRYWFVAGDLFLVHGE